MAHEHSGDLDGKARSTLSRYGMLSGGERVVVSVSGGPDSVALLLFLTELADEMDLKLSVFHLDHMIRGEDSRQDAIFVQRLADRLGLVAEVVEVDVKNDPGSARRSPQDAARTIRLERLLDFAERRQADRVAVGHTADDQVETFLMRMVQGAGLTGLAGIGPVSGMIIRPLIETWRFEVEDYLARKNQSARMDRTNLEMGYLRNRVRYKLLPCIVSEFGNAAKSVILRDVESLAKDREMFQELARTAFGDVARFEEGQVRVDRSKLLALAPSIQRGVIREAWARLLPGQPMLGWQHAVDVFDKVVNGASGASIELPRGIVAEREYDDIIIGRKEPDADPLPTVSLDVPGTVRLPAGIIVESLRVPRSEVVFNADRDVEFVRPDVTTPLEVRGPRAGERFRPLGTPFQRKLKDYFIDVKLPRRERRTVPLVLEDGHVVWVAGHRLDDRYRLRPTDDAAIMLRLRREGE